MTPALHQQAWYQLGVLQFTSILILTSQSYHQIQVKEQPSKTVLDFKCHLLVGSMGHTSVWLGYKFGSAHAFENSLGWFTELRKMLYLQRFCYKGHKQPNEEIHSWQGLEARWKHMSFLPHGVWLYHSPSTSVCSPTRKLLQVSAYWGFFFF